MCAKRATQQANNKKSCQLSELDARRDKVSSPGWPLENAIAGSADGVRWLLLDQVPRRRDDRRDKTASKISLAQQRVILHCCLTFLQSFAACWRSEPPGRRLASVVGTSTPCKMSCRVVGRCPTALWGYMEPGYSLTDCEFDLFGFKLL